MSGLCDHGSITFASDWSGHAASVAAPLHDAGGARHRAPRYQLTLGGAEHQALLDQSRTTETETLHVTIVPGAPVKSADVNCAAMFRFARRRGGSALPRRRSEGDEEPRPGRFGAPQLPVGLMGSTPRSPIDRQPERTAPRQNQPCPTATRHSSAVPPSVNSQNDSILKWTYSRVPRDQFPLTSFTSLCLANVSKSVQTRTSVLLL